MLNRSLRELHQGLLEGKWTSVDLVEQCFAAIAENDQDGRNLNSICELNPDALFIARALDKELKEKGPRGLLHGIPLVVKDNISTKDDMHTTAGSLALNDLIAPYDAEVIRQLRTAGAVILGKACLSEFAYFMSRNKMPSGYSSRAGQVVHPYHPGFDPSGSSSGSAVAVAARLVPVAVGTETNGSLVSPSRNNAIVTIKPTVGLVSRHGIIPISHHQDTAGPMAKSVEDCAILLEAMQGKDEKDAVTWDSPEKTSYTESLIDHLNGMRIGVLSFDDYPFNERVLQLKAKLIQTIESLGAEAVEVSLPTSRVVMPNVLNHEFKNGINRYLATVQGRTAMRSLEDIIQFNKEHATLCLRFGQDLLTQSDAFSGQLKESDYIRQRMQATKNTRAAIDGLLKQNNLDCLASLLVTGYAPVAGYPCLAIPVDRINEEQPDPVSCVFIGTAYSESVLIHAAYAIEKKLDLQCCPSWIKK